MNATMYFTDHARGSTLGYGYAVDEQGPMIIAGDWRPMSSVTAAILEHGPVGIEIEAWQIVARGDLAIDWVTQWGRHICRICNKPREGVTFHPDCCPHKGDVPVMDGPVEVRDRRYCVDCRSYLIPGDPDDETGETSWEIE